MLKELDTDKEDLERLNDIIRNNDFFQQLMLKEGLGRKYWNTMIPYIKNGVNEKVVNHEYQYPFRLIVSRVYRVCIIVDFVVEIKMPNTKVVL